MTIINEHRIPDSILTAEQIEAAKTPEDRAQEAEMVAAAAEREADRKAVRAILDSINADVIDAAQATKAAAQAILDATAPTNVAGCWTQIKAAARVIRDTDNALIEAGRAVKALAKYARDL